MTIFVSPQITKIFPYVEVLMSVWLFLGPLLIYSLCVSLESVSEARLLHKELPWVIQDV